MARLLTFALISLAPLLLGETQAADDKEPPKKDAAKPADDKSDKAADIDPWNRPEGSIVGKPKRFYLWYAAGKWSLRCCSVQLNTFHGTVKVSEGGRIKSTLPVGLKEGKKDAWRVNAERNQLEFGFKASTASDGLDIEVEGDDAQLEFDLKINDKQDRKWVFIGKSEQHPPKVPFTLPVVPPKKKPAEKK